MVIFQPLWILESSIYVKGVSKAGLVTALQKGKWKFKNAFSVWVEPLLRRRQRNAQFMGGKNKKLRCLWHEKKMFEIQFRMTCILILGLFSEGSWQQLILLCVKITKKVPYFEFSPQNWALFSIHTSSIRRYKNNFLDEIWLYLVTLLLSNFCWRLPNTLLATLKLYCFGCYRNVSGSSTARSPFNYHSYTDVWELMLQVFISAH